MNSPSTSHYLTSEAHLPDWIDIMVHPRSAIQHIVATRSLLWAVALTMAASLLGAGTQVLDLYRDYPVELYAFGIFPDMLLWLIPLSLVLAPIGLVVGAFVNAVVGRLLGGSGDTRDMMICNSWSNIPNIGAQLVVLASQLMRLWLEATGHAPLARLLWLPTFPALAVALYSLVLNVVTVSEVHQFSVGRALLTLLLLPLLIAGFAFTCAICFLIGNM